MTRSGICIVDTVSKISKAGKFPWHKGPDIVIFIAFVSRYYPMNLPEPRKNIGISTGWALASYKWSYHPYEVISLDITSPFQQTPRGLLRSSSQKVLGLVYPLKSWVPYISQTTYQGSTSQSVFWFPWNTSSYFSPTGMHLRTLGSTMVMGSMVIIQSYPESIYPFICFKLLNISKKLLPPICANQLQPHVATLLLLNASAACLLSPGCKASQAKRHRTLPIFYRCYWRKSNIEGLLATSHCPGSDWKKKRKVMLWRHDGHVTLSRLWLKLAPNVMRWRPAGHVTLSRLWLKMRTKT